MSHDGKNIFALPTSSTAQSPTPKDRPDDQHAKIIGLLTQLGSRLAESEIDRRRMKTMLERYQDQILSLEDKTALSEKAFISLQQRLFRNEGENPAGQIGIELLETRLQQIAAESETRTAALETRLDETERRQREVLDKMEDTVKQQERAARRLEHMAQDRLRLMRRIERLEENVNLTRDAVNAKAFVLMTERGGTELPPPPQNDAAAEIQVQSPGALPLLMNKALSRWKKPTALHSTSLAAIVAAALLTGWWVADRNASAPLPAQSPAVTATESLTPDERNATAPAPLSEQRPQPGISAPQPAAAADLPTTTTAPQAPDPLAALSKAIEIGENPQPPDQSVEDILAAQAALLNEIEPSVQAEGPAETPPVRARLSEEVLPEEVLSEEALAPAKGIPPDGRKKMEVLRKSYEADLSGVDQAKAQNTLAGLSATALSEKSTLSSLQPDPALPPIVQEIETQAFKGMPEAQHDLAAIYTAGHGGVAKNYERAAAWFHESARGGVANARYNLGVLYHQGLGVPRDVGKAIQWYAAAARLGHPEALYNLGIAHIEGIGAAYDPHLAAAFFEKAAASKISEAAYNLGLIYENGLIGERKPEIALFWYKKAADQGNQDAAGAMKQLARTLGIKVEDINRLFSLTGPDGTPPKSASLEPPAKSAATPPKAASALVARIQEALMESGLYPGPADGVMGPLTQDAIRAYQKQANLKEDGLATGELLDIMTGQSLTASVPSARTTR